MLLGTAIKKSPVVRGAAVYDLTPPLEAAGEVNSRVIVASAHGETHVFPTAGPVRVLISSPTENRNDTLKSLGYRTAPAPRG